MRRLIAVVVIVACPGMGTALAQQAKPAPNRLASVRTLSCSFPSYTATNWTGLEPASRTGTEDFTFNVTDINIRRSRARIVAGTASADATAMLTATSLNIIEPTQLGNLILTSVFVSGGEDRKFLAVHSRHLGDLTAAPSASQHFGSCDATE